MLRFESMDAKDEKLQIPERRNDPVERDRLIMEYAPLVKRIAFRIVSRLPDTIRVEDLISIGTLGLIDAIEKYNPEKGKGFRAYAELRIKGAILDELRGYDILSRSNRRWSNRILEITKELEQELGRRPFDEEVAEKLEISMEEFHTLRNQTRTLVFLDIEDADYRIAGEASDAERRGINHGEFEPFAKLADKALKERLAAAIEKLPEKLRLVLSLYYYSELNYKEIGKVLSLSESRISQLHTKAIVKLRKILAAQETMI